MKNTLLTAVSSFVFVLSTLAQIPNYVPTNGLFGWYPFNGNANDGSGNGHNGTVHNAALVSDRFGNGSNAYNFNGTSSHIDLGALQIGDSYEPLTISLWYKDQIPATVIAGILISDYNSGTNPPYDLTFAFNLQRWFKNNLDNTARSGDFLVSRRSGTLVSQNAGYRNGVFDASWHHIAIIYDGVDKVIWYQDGVRFDSSWINNFGVKSMSTYNASANYIDNTVWEIGCQRFNGALTTFFSGCIDDIGIWKRALLQHEIMSLFTNTVVLSIEKTVSYLSVFPNPSTTSFTLQLSSPPTPQTYFQLYDALGRQVRREEIVSESSTIHRSNLPNGIYFWQLQSANRILDRGKVAFE